MVHDFPQLLKMSRAELDALFAASDAGPMPEGGANGIAIVASDAEFSLELAKLINVFTWYDKEFDPVSKTLRSRIDPFGLNAIIAKVYKAPSWLDGRDSIVVDYSDTSLLDDRIRDEIRQIQAPSLYLGRMYWAERNLMDFALEF